MEQINQIINAKNIRDTSKKTHKQRLSFLYTQLKDDIYRVSKVKKFINERYDNENTRRNYYDSMYNLTNKKSYKNIMDKLINVVNEKRNNNLVDGDKWLTLDELKLIPFVLKNKISVDYGAVWLTHSSLFYSLNKRQQQRYARDIIDYVILSLHIYHPIRLDYYNIKFAFKKSELNKSDNFILISKKNNYAELYMNIYKNSDNYETTNVQPLDRKIADILIHWINLFTLITNKMPTYVLYTLKSDLELVPYTQRASLGAYLSILLKKYSNKHLTINDIRKIHESAFIQSDEYNQITNSEKIKQHSKLLHSQSTAITDYNKIKAMNK